METTNRALNIGAGRKPFKDWINLDIGPGPNVDVIADWLWLPFADESMDIINASQVFEHIDIVHRGQALKEAWRVLRYGGQLHIDVPDLPSACRNLLDGKVAQAFGGIYGGSYLKGGAHLWGYSRRALNQIVWDAGFAVTKLELDDTCRIPSIFVEALKIHGTRPFSAEDVDVRNVHDDVTHYIHRSTAII